MPESKRFTVEQRGIGKPDYSREISLGRVRPGFTLKYNQTLQIFGVTFSDIVTPYPQVVPFLAAGGTQNLIDWSTGLALPFTVPQGYTYTAMQMSHSMTQDFTVRTYFGTPPAPTFFVGHLVTKAAGIPSLFAEVSPMSTRLFDPTGATAHAYDVILENLGGAAMEGTISIFAIMEAVGTVPLPENKTVKCKWCEHQWIVPNATTAINCPNCGELNIYFDLTKIRTL